MTVRHQASRRWPIGVGTKGRLALAGVVSLLGWAGCGEGTLPRDPSPSTLDPFSQLDLGGFTDQVERDGNEDFSQAQQLRLGFDKTLTLAGEIDRVGDVDVYDIGGVSAGDRVVAEMFPSDSLPAVIAIFDGSGESLLINDHRNVYLGRKEPYVDVVFRRSSDQCYIAVAATPGTDGTGEYELAIFKSAGKAPLTARSQIALLNFNGRDNLALGGRSPTDIPPFDAASVAPRFAGQTEAMEAYIVASVRQDYLGLDVTILSTSEGAVDDGSMTLIHFGTFDPGLLGVAEGVDEFNERPAQHAIVFTNTFAAFSPLAPSVSQMGQAIGNVASHELGHLLGLIHTNDFQGIMDVTASLSELLRDQRFTVSPIDGQVFPLGNQNTPQYLFDTLGGDIGLINQAASLTNTVAIEPRGRRRTVVDVARGSLVFGSCGS